MPICETGPRLHSASAPFIAWPSHAGATRAVNPTSVHVEVARDVAVSVQVRVA